MPRDDSPAQLHTFAQGSQFASPWSFRSRVAALAWEFCWGVFCRWTPKPCNPWRLLWLRIFGAKIDGNPFVHQRARVQLPWNLTLHDRATLGDGANAYSLGEIEVKCRAIVAQEAYLCTGTHDFSSPHLPLQVGKITVGEDAFVAARAFVMPGISIGPRAIVGAAAVVTRDVPADAIVAGNPARRIGDRPPIHE